MKRVFSLLMVFATLMGCKQYELDTSFTAPTELDAPEVVLLDVSSSERIVFFWSGARSDDGGIILYDVLFDKDGGDFTSPLATFQSDRGSQPRLTLTHSQLNAIARESGIARNQTGTLLWTVRASRGGEVKDCGIVKEISLTRGNDIDELPESLTPAGSAFAEEGRTFISKGSGVFVLITRVQAGTMSFTSGTDNFYVDSDDTIVIGEGSSVLTPVPESGLALVTVDFNSLKFSIDELSTSVQAQWAATNAAFVILQYKGEGLYSGKGKATFLGPGRPGTPSWCSWAESRYSFMTEVNNVPVRWGSRWPNPDGADSADYPATPEDYYISQVDKTDWGNLWKMAASFDQKTVLMSIYLDENGRLTHSIEETEADPEPEPEAAYYITGEGAEVDNQHFLKIDDNTYRLYAKLAGGAITVTNGTDSYPFNVDATPVEADATRLTVNISSKTLTAEVVNKVNVIYAYDSTDLVPLTYTGAGVWSGSGGVWFRTVSWGKDERYSFILTVDGSQTLCIGRKDTTDPENRPDGQQAADYFDGNEFSWDKSKDQWNHLWKLPSVADNGVTATITLYTEKDGVITHTVTIE